MSVQSSPRKALQPLSPNKIMKTPKSTPSRKLTKTVSPKMDPLPFNLKPSVTQSRPKESPERLEEYIPSSPINTKDPADSESDSQSRSVYEKPAATSNAEQIAYELRLRLRFAYYKVVTDQKRLPLSELPPPDTWSVQAFLDATAKSRRESFRFQSFQPQLNKESDVAAEGLLSLST